MAQIEADICHGYLSKLAALNHVLNSCAHHSGFEINPLPISQFRLGKARYLCSTTWQPTLMRTCGFMRSQLRCNFSFARSILALLALGQTI